MKKLEHKIKELKDITQDGISAENERREKIKEMGLIVRDIILRNLDKVLDKNDFLLSSNCFDIKEFSTNGVRILSDINEYLKNIFTIYSNITGYTALSIEMNKNTSFFIHSSRLYIDCSDIGSLISFIKKYNIKIDFVTPKEIKSELLGGINKRTHILHVLNKLMSTQKGWKTR